MKKTAKVMMIAAVMIMGTAVFAGPHHRVERCNPFGWIAEIFRPKHHHHHAPAPRFRKPEVTKRHKQVKHKPAKPQHRPAKPVHHRGR